jgi:elongation factor P
MRFRAIRKGRRPAWFSGSHHRRAVDGISATHPALNKAGHSALDQYGAPAIAGGEIRGKSLKRGHDVKVIASSVRKGNILEIDGALYTVLSAESFFPGKGTPTTQVEMRRLSDGVKTVQRYKTTEQVERAYVEQTEHTYLYEDGDGYVFMNPQTYDQVHVSADVIGDQAVYLQENMPCQVSIFDGVAVAIELPQKVTLEVMETEPTMKGQTASSSYKPAILSNGARTMVPPHIAAGTRVVVMTADGSYVERAKD